MCGALLVLGEGVDSPPVSCGRRSDRAQIREEGSGAVGGGQLLERAPVLHAMAGLLEGVRAGRGGALFVLGEPGLGKTSCLAQATALAAPAMRVGLGRGDVMETSLPFGILIPALDAVGNRDLLTAPPAGAEFGDVRAARFYHVLRWLEQLTDPVLLALDDLHWADPDSLALLSFLCRRLAGLPVGVLGTLRPWPADAQEVTGALVYDGCAGMQRLAPLSEDAVATLLEARLGEAVTGTVACTAAQLCAGNPLLLEQVAASLGQPTQEQGWLPPGTAVGAEGILLTRFAGLPPDALDTARAASVLGTRFRPAVATTMAGLGEQPAGAALSALCRSGLVRGETEEIAGFVHPLFGQSLYHDLAAPVRARLHARAFAVLREHGLETEAVEHAIRADLVGDRVAITAVEQAGRAALAAGALGTAAEHLRAAVRLAGDRAGTSLLLALGEALLIAGQPGEAIEVYERLHRQAAMGPRERVQTLRMLGRALFVTAGSHQAIRRLTEATALAESFSETTVAEVLLDEAVAALFGLGPGHALPLASRARELTRSAPESVRRRVSGVWGLAALLTGDRSGLVVSAAAARELMSGSIEPPEVRSNYGPLGAFSLAALFAERFAEAEQALAVVLAAADRIGAAESAAMHLVIKAAVATRQGQLADGLAAADQALAYGELMPYREGSAGMAKAEALLLLGRSAECMAWCQRAEAIALSRGQSYVLMRLWHVRAQLLRQRGDSDGECALYERIEEQTTTMGIGEPCAALWARHAVLAYLTSGRPGDAHRMIGWLERGAARLPCRWPRIAAAAGRAALAEASGEAETAHRHHQDALVLHQQVELPLEHVETLLGYGAFLRRRGRPTLARPHLARALEIAERCGAVWLADQARDELSTAGGRRRRRHEDPTRLTAQEQRVARLAAAGHSNKAIAGRLCLSTKTVEYHLAQIYTKLGITSRRQLMTGHPISSESEEQALGTRDNPRVGRSGTS